MKKIILAFCIATASISTEVSLAQTQTVSTSKSLERPYNPEDNAQESINKLIAKAKKEKKYVILQAGGNWCSWCLLFNDFTKTNKKVNSYLKNNYLYYHLNTSKENKNEAVFKKYAPEGEKLGYPFFVVLDGNGKVVTIQESGSLEQGKGYNENKVLDFLKKARSKKLIKKNPNSFELGFFYS